MKILKNQICVIKLVVLRRGVQRVIGAYHRVITPEGNTTAPSEEMLQRWRSKSSTVFDLIGPRLEPQTSRSRDKLAKYK